MRRSWSDETLNALAHGGTVHGSNVQCTPPPSQRRTQQRKGQMASGANGGSGGERAKGAGNKHHKHKQTSTVQTTQRHGEHSASIHLPNQRAGDGVRTSCSSTTHKEASKQNEVRPRHNAAIVGAIDTDRTQTSNDANTSIARWRGWRTNSCRMHRDREQSRGVVGRMKITRS
jgi:uncharacterized protein involved in copper resistance